MKIKTSELTGAALDWAVMVAKYGCKAPVYVHSRNERSRTWARAKGYAEEKIAERFQGEDFQLLVDDNGQDHFLSPLGWWEAGPLIERERLEIMPTTGEERAPDSWEVRKFISECELYAAYGPTPLVAAMRCYVAFKLGDVVDIPDELCTS